MVIFQFSMKYIPYNNTIFYVLSNEFFLVAAIFNYESNYSAIKRYTQVVTVCLCVSVVNSFT